MILKCDILQNNAEEVKYLLLAGANPNTKDNAGWTPLVRNIRIDYSLLFFLIILLS